MNRVVLTLVTVACLVPTALGSQTAQRIAVLTEPGTPVVASEFLLTVGPSDEEPPLAGLTYLAARAVVSPLQEAFDSLGAHVNVTAHKDALSFSVIAAPDAWEEATRLLLAGLFRSAPDSVSVTRERSATVAELAARLSNPADAATRDLDAAFFGPEHPWGRPTVGTQQSVQRIRLADVAAHLRANFTPERALAAVAGPVTEADVRQHLLPLIGSGRPAAVDLIPYRSAGRPVRRDYNSITSWISASFKFPETGDEEALRFVAYLAADALSFSPTNRSVYDVSAQFIPRVGGGEIRLQVVVPPEEAERWAERVDEAVTALETREMRDDVFEAHLRRYRGRRMLDLLNPEERARAAARELLVTGEFDGLVPDLDEMTPGRVRDAARSLSQPTLIILGPSLN